MTSTDNYNLTKFSESEYYNVNLFNDNMDKVDAAIEDAKDVTPERVGYASIEQAGVIKPLTGRVNGQTVNRSGLVISDNGTTYVNTRADRGITRDSSGQIGINPSTQAETDAGAETYKPITPKTLRNLKKVYEVDSTKTTTGSNTLHITIPGVASYDDLIGKTIKVYTGEYINTKTQNIYLNVNGLGGRVILRAPLDNSIGTYTYAPYEINRYMIMELYVSESDVRWTDPIGGVTGELRNMQQYSTSPQRIGTWVDGTPIWRVVIQQSISEQDREDKAIHISLPVKDWTVPFVVNDYMRLIYDTDCAVDDCKLPAFSGGGYALPSWISVNTTYDKISGWIEFATPESNINI